MNITIINHYAGSPEMGMEFRPYYFAREWIRAGHQVQIVAASYSHLRYCQPKINKSFRLENIDGINYFWIRSLIYKKNGLKRFSSMLDFVWKLFRFKNKIFSEAKPDLIIASSTYPFDNYFGRWAAKKYKAKYCYEVHDLWPLSPLELGGFSKKHPMIILMQHAEDFAYKYCDFVVSLLPKAEEYMKSRGLADEKFCYIPNGAVASANNDDINTGPEKHHQLLTNLKKDAKLIIGYLGGHAVSNALEFFILAAEKLKDKTDLHFVLVGKGQEKEKLQRVVDNKKLKNISFLPPVEKRSVPWILSKMDVLYIGWRNQKLYQHGISPNKIFDYMMAGKPIVHSVTKGNDIVDDANCGITVSAENCDEIANAILRLSKMSESERHKIGQNGYRYVKENFMLQDLADKYLNILKQ